MRTILHLAALSLVLGLPGLAAADPQMSPKPSQQAATAPAAQSNRDYPAGEACWGDSRENDADLNDGNRISTEEILRIINPAQS